MLGIRPYKPCDAAYIVPWLADKTVFQLWGGERFGSYPLTIDKMNRKYQNDNGDCAEEDNFYPFTAFDGETVVGHFIMRYLGGDRKRLRFGWVVVDSEKRGKKYGQTMLILGLQFAFDFMCVESVSIGLFEHNIPAFRCYCSVGFREDTTAEAVYETVDGERQRIVELLITREEYEQL